MGVRNYHATLMKLLWTSDHINNIARSLLFYKNIMNPSSASVAKVILWSTLRSVSTAYERSIRTLQDVKVYHEYYSIAAALGEERFYPAFEAEEPRPG